MNDKAIHVIETEDRVKLVEGDRAFNYYGMKAGRIGAIDDHAEAGFHWFDFIHDDGSHTLLNGPRICSIAFATRKGWLTETQCEWEDAGRDYDGRWMTFNCNRKATTKFTDDGNTTWDFCSEHAIKAAETNLKEVK